MEKMVTSSAIGSIVFFTQIQIMNKLHPDIGLMFRCEYDGRKQC